MSDIVVDKHTIQSTFDQWQQSLNGQRDQPLNAARRKALEAFSALGYPGRKSERWKYTNLQKILELGFEPALGTPVGEITPEAFAQMALPERDAVRLVFVNGKFHEGFSVLRDIKGLNISFYGQDANARPDGAAIESEGLWYLNAAFATSGAIIEVDDKAIIDTPIELYNITTCPGTDMIQPKHHVRIGNQASAKIVESYHNLCVGLSFTNCAHTIEVGDQAYLGYIKLEHPRQTNTYIVDHTTAVQGKDSTFNIYTFTLSGAMVRNNLEVRLAGENATTNMYGLYVLEKEQHADNSTIVDHAVPNCYSNELYKGILDGHSTGVFNGRIIVREDAQKTNAYQNNRNILMSEHASVNSMPQLEIFADDVKCSHGATSAQIEDSELFYLRARGIGKEKARALLMFAFAGEIWETIKDEAVRHFVQREVGHALGMETE